MKIKIVMDSINKKFTAYDITTGEIINLDFEIESFEYNYPITDCIYSTGEFKLPLNNNLPLYNNIATGMIDEFYYLGYEPIVCHHEFNSYVEYYSSNGISKYKICTKCGLHIIYDDLDNLDNIMHSVRSTNPIGD